MAPKRVHKDELRSILKTARTLAVITIGGIGDHLFAIPFLASIRAAYPSLDITQLSTQPKAAALCHSVGLTTRIIPVDPPASGRGSRAERWARFLLQTRQARLARFDVSVFLATGLTQRIAAWQFAIGARIRIGTSLRPSNYAAWFHYISAESPDQHHIDRNLQLAAILGGRIVDPMAAFDYALKPKRRAGIANLVVLHPFQVSATRDGRQWPLARFREVYERLTGYGLTVTVVGTAEELCSPELAQWPALRVHALTSLADSAQLLGEAQLVIGNDSAVVHLASALGVKTLSVVGSTDPRSTGPYRNGGVARLSLSCSPCFDDKRFRHCSSFACMEWLSAEAVIRHPLVEDVVRALPSATVR